MGNINTNALRNIGYGLYVLTARENDKDNGCIINVCQQVTDSPLQIMIAVNKKNLTHDMILRTGRFNISVLTEEAPFKVFQHFGLQSGRDVNKFENCDTEVRAQNGIRYLPRYINAYFSAVLKHSVDLGSHTMIIAEVTEAAHISDIPSVTYSYYHQNIKPKPAPTTTGKSRWVCQICGYVYEGENMPDDFICPLCKHGKADFVKMTN